MRHNTDKTMKDHTVRMRPHRWKQIEEIAFNLTLKCKTLVKPTDVLDAALHKGLKKITYKDLEIAEKGRRESRKNGA